MNRHFTTLSPFANSLEFAPKYSVQSTLYKTVKPSIAITITPEETTTMSTYTITDLVPLPDSNVKIPRLGFGVYRSPTAQCVESCLNALKAGYRHIDTAQLYGNEKEVGEAIRKSGIPRNEIFVTTKILSPGGSPEATYEKLLASVEKIGGKDGYVDLFLIHSSKSGPAGRKEFWLALERLLAEGKTRSIGVSNYGVQHIEEMREYATVWPPHVNQLEVSLVWPFFFPHPIYFCSRRDDICSFTHGANNE